MRGRKRDLHWLQSLRDRGLLSMPSEDPIRLTKIHTGRDGEPGYVYFIKTKGIDAYKVGYSGNPLRRMFTIYGTATAEEHVEVICIWWRENAFQAEQRLLAFMRDFLPQRKKVSEQFYGLDIYDEIRVLNFMEHANP